MKIKWKEGSRFNCTAGEAYNFFERIRSENDGYIDWDEAERQARPKDSPVHDDLEWDNKKCGTLYRKAQLQRMVRRIETIHPKMKTSTRVYESVKMETVAPDADTAGKSPEQIRQARVFMKTDEILANPAARADLLNRAVREALAFRRKYAALSELAGIIRVIDEEVSHLV